VILLCVLTAGACTSRKNKLDRSNLIPEKELVSILTDVYVADGILSIPKIHSLFSSADSISTYHQVIEDHGYSKEVMDKTMKYYFIKEPKKLIVIYDQVLGILSEKESLIQKEAAITEARRLNLWTGKEIYSLPDRADNDSTSFDITLSRAGVYHLVFTVTLFPYDQSLNPRITTYSCHPDSIDSGKKNYLKSINYIKDGQPHTYVLKLIVPDIKPLHFRGILYDFENNTDIWDRHVLIENISLVYS
jgi:hypothetical protein